MTNLFGRPDCGNELSQRLVRYCLVEDATLEGAFAVNDSVINNVHTLTNYV